MSKGKIQSSFLLAAIGGNPILNFRQCRVSQSTFYHCEHTYEMHSTGFFCLCYDSYTDILQKAKLRKNANSINNINT